MKDPKEDAVEQQTNSALYFTNFKWGEKNLYPFILVDNRKI